MNPSICLPVSLLVRPSDCPAAGALLVNLSICSPVSLRVCLSVQPACLPATVRFLWICPSARPSACLSVCLTGRPVVGRVASIHGTLHRLRSGSRQSARRLGRIITEMIRIRPVLLDMKNRMFGPYSVAVESILISVMHRVTGWGCFL
jgi:hypothetical protein